MESISKSQAVEQAPYLHFGSRIRSTDASHQRATSWRGVCHGIVREKDPTSSYSNAPSEPKNPSVNCERSVQRAPLHLGDGRCQEANAKPGFERDIILTAGDRSARLVPPPALFDGLGNISAPSSHLPFAVAGFNSKFSCHLRYTLFQVGHIQRK